MIRRIQTDDLKEAIDLVNAVFYGFIADDYSPEGVRTFTDYLSCKLEEMTEDLISGNKKLWGYFEGDRIVGVIGTRDTFHISLLFVDRDFQNRGIARQLFNTVLEELKNAQSGKSFQITVNSSPYAVKIYEKLGFTAIGPETENKGIRYTPMKMMTR
jgi:ribosomal protein S18 acetylase RimI-like enzyme